MRIPYRYFLEDIRIRYNIEEKFSRGFIYVRIKQGMYGLKQAAILTYKQLMKHLKTRGYYTFTGTNAIFPHKKRGKTFCL